MCAFSPLHHCGASLVLISLCECGALYTAPSLHPPDLTGRPSCPVHVLAPGSLLYQRSRCHGRCPLTHQPSNRLTTHRPNNRPHHLPAEPPPHLRKPPFHLPSRQDGPGPAHPGHAARARNPAARARARHCATTRRPARCASAGAKAASGAAAPAGCPSPPSPAPLFHCNWS